MLVTVLAFPSLDLQARPIFVGGNDSNAKHFTAIKPEYVLSKLHYKQSKGHCL